MPLHIGQGGVQRGQFILREGAQLGVVGVQQLLSLLALAQRLFKSIDMGHQLLKLRLFL